METWLLISLIVVGLGLAIWMGNKISKIFKGEDGKWSADEFLKMLGAGSLLTMASYMIYKEANRIEEWQLFGPLYIFLIVGGFLSAVHLDKVLDVALKIFGKDKKDEKP